MRKLAVWIGVLALAGSAGAISNPALKPSFADLTWYSNRQAVKAQMQKRGYFFVREIQDAGAVDVEYSGKIQGLNARILHMFNNSNQLVKTSIVIDNSLKSSLYSNWMALKNGLDSKYGMGRNLTDVPKDYLTPDFMLESQLNAGKQLINGWMFPTYSYLIVLTVRQAFVNNTDYFVSLAYESPAWGKEMDRRGQDGDL